MLTHIAFALGVLTQVAPPPSNDRRSADPGVRIWVSDTLYQVGAGARVYVKLREPGYLTVLHTDAMGRIRVLYPLAPDQQAIVPAGDPFEVTGPDDGTTFRVEARGRGTLLAVRASRPFYFEPLRRANRWDYEQSLLLQPTAGNAFAALLDIADRVGEGQPYDYDVTFYGTPGALASRAGSDTVCFSCLTARHPRSSTAGPGGYGNGAVATNNSSAVDCSGANLVNSWCGVQDNSVSNTYTDNSTYQSTTVEYPVYVPFFVPFRRFFRREPPPAPPPPRPATTLPMPLRPVSRRLVPPPARQRPTIVVVQPTAPSHPDLGGGNAEPAPAVSAPAGTPPPARMARTAGMETAASMQARLAAPTRMNSMGGSATFSAPAGSARPVASTVTRPAVSTTRALVPSRAQVRSINAGRH